MQLLRKLEGYPFAASVDLMNLISWWKRSELEHIFQAQTSDQIKEPQFGPKQKDIFIKLPYKGQQSDIVKRLLTRLYAKVAPWLKLNFIFFASNRIKRLSK